MIINACWMQLFLMTHTFFCFCLFVCVCVFVCFLCVCVFFSRLYLFFLALFEGGLYTVSKLNHSIYSAFYHSTDSILILLFHAVKHSVCTSSLACHMSMVSV